MFIVVFVGLCGRTTVPSVKSKRMDASNSSLAIAIDCCANASLASAVAATSTLDLAMMTEAFVVAQLGPANCTALTDVAFSGRVFLGAVSILAPPGHRGEDRRWLDDLEPSMIVLCCQESLWCGFIVKFLSPDKY